jgi:hypothetical protein
MKKSQGLLKAGFGPPFCYRVRYKFFLPLGPRHLTENTAPPLGMLGARKAGPCRATNSRVTWPNADNGDIEKPFRLRGFSS